MAFAMDMTLHVIATAMCHAEVVLAEFTVRKRRSFTARCDPRWQSPGRQKSSRLHFVFPVQIAEISRGYGRRCVFRKNREGWQHWIALRRLTEPTTSEAVTQWSICATTYRRRNFIMALKILYNTYIHRLKG